MENTKGTMSVEDLLRQGRSAEDLMQMLENELATAQAKIDNEKKVEQEKEDKERAKHLDVARADLVEALIEYCGIIGICDSFDTEEDMAELHDLIYKALKEYEEEFKTVHRFFKGWIKPKRKVKQDMDMDIDDIIHNFIAKL